ncbi:MAG: hypothetical protein AABM29_09340 [Actinomycetota bacterium]
MTPISFRPDSAAAEALAYLEERGFARSEAIRLALVELADRARRDRIRREVAEISADPEDRAEKKRITELMDSLAAEDEV